MKRECRTQAELDKAQADGVNEIGLVGNGYFILKSGKVVAWESSRVEARGSSSVVAWGSSSVVARESSRVEAWESSRVEAWESSRVVATAYCSVHIQQPSLAEVKGGVQIKVPPINTAKAWCAYYGVSIIKNVVVLFKAVRDNYKSQRGGDYTPGTVPKCSDWDGGKEECGGGLHFVPHPSMGLGFDSEATKFIAVPVWLKDIVVHCPARYQHKVKAPHGCAPCWEVDRWGERVDSKK